MEKIIQLQIPNDSLRKIDEIYSFIRELKNKSESNKKWFTASEAADYLGVSQSSVYNLKKYGKLDFEKVGKKTVINKEQLDKLLIN